MDYEKGKVGLPPGTPVHTGVHKPDEVKIRVIDYDEESMDLLEDATVADCVPSEKDNGIRWVQVQGVYDVEIIESIGNSFGIHPLTLEDIVRTEQRPKLETIQSGVYMVARSYMLDPKMKTIRSEQISIILGEKFVLTFQESDMDLFDAVVKRALQSIGRIRKSGTDYLTYAILDVIVDNYFVVLEKLGEQIEYLEDTLIANASTRLLEEIYRLKRIVIAMRKSVWPLREVVFGFNRNEVFLVQESTQVYLRDLYDHVLRVTDHLEMYRESLTGALDIYLSSVSNRMNEVMKVLTVISTVFIPLTLIASIYGMNFVNMPEIQWPYAYPVVLLVMVVITIGLLGFFRRIEWV